MTILASKPFKSYRYKGDYGYIYIGAMNNEEALREARRSIASYRKINRKNLQYHNGSDYVDCYQK